MTTHPPVTTSSPSIHHCHTLQPDSSTGPPYHTLSISHATAVPRKRRRWQANQRHIRTKSAKPAILNPLTRSNQRNQRHIRTKYLAIAAAPCLTTMFTRLVTIFFTHCCSTLRARGIHAGHGAGVCTPAPAQLPRHAHTLHPRRLPAHTPGLPFFVAAHSLNNMISLALGHFAIIYKLDGFGWGVKLRVLARLTPVKNKSKHPPRRKHLDDYNGT